MAEVARTIVKSPPELWAEVSDPEALSRHLGAFGEIRITRLEPEATVAWEGDRVRGTVDLSPAGWGTKVRVTAEELETLEEPEAVVEPEPEPEEPPQVKARWWSRWRRRPVETLTIEEPPVETEVEIDDAPDEDTPSVLDGMLDSLGSAHHRPFSRG